MSNYPPYCTSLNTVTGREWELLHIGRCCLNKQRVGKKDEIPGRACLPLITRRQRASSKTVPGAHGYLSEEAPPS